MPIGNITQDVSTIPAPPHRGVDVQTVFVTKQEDFQDHLADITIDELNTFKDQLNTRIGEINSTATTMNGYASTASAGASTATTKAGEASTSASEALTSRNQADSFKNNASTSATKASQWADNNYNVEVETGRYSAKHWAGVAENFGGDTAKLKSTNITVNVGTGQTYTTINQALEYLSGFYPMYKKSGVTATINLKAGFVMAEQVLVSGIDLGWITIVGEDAETIITHTVLTTAFNFEYPAFGVDKSGTSPVIGQLFRFNVEKVGGNKHGLMTCGAGSSAYVLSGKGFIGAGNIGISAVNGSTISAPSANCSNAGTNGIYAVNGSTISAPSANCSNAGTNGIYVVNGSTISAPSANCSNAGTNGIYAIFNSTISAYGANCSNAGNIGIRAVESSTISANGANCSNAGNIGIRAEQSSTISAYSAKVQNQTTGTVRVKIDSGSYIDANLLDTTGGTVTAFSQAVNTLTQSGIIYG